MEMPAMPIVPRSESEEVLFARRVRSREPAAFEQFVVETCWRMLIVARRFLSNEDDAYDAVQDAFLSAFRSVDQFDGHARLTTWLHRIVINACLMKLRTKQRHPECSIEAFLPHFCEDEHRINDSKPWTIRADDAAERAETRQLVRDTIEQLPEIYRIVLVLRDIEELDTEETARLLNTSAGVVKTRLHRARQALREMLDPHMKETRP